MSTNAYRQSVASASLAALTNAIGPNSTITYYSGTPPASCDAALSGNTALTSGTITSWSAPTYSSGSAAMVSTASMSASGYGVIASGVATFARIATSGGVVVRQPTIGTSGAEITIGNTTIQTGTTIPISYQITEGCDSV